MGLLQNIYRFKTRTRFKIVNDQTGLINFNGTCSDFYQNVNLLKTKIVLFCKKKNESHIVFFDKYFSSLQNTFHEHICSSTYIMALRYCLHKCTTNNRSVSMITSFLKTLFVRYVKTNYSWRF